MYPSAGEYIELPSVVQIQYILDIHGTTITCHITMKGVSLPSDSVLHSWSNLLAHYNYTESD